jgi:hypothetical protein
MVLKLVSYEMAGTGDPRLIRTTSPILNVLIYKDEGERMQNMVI